MENLIKKIILDLGADVCGIAGVERFEGAPKGFRPVDVFKECESVLVFGKALPKGLLSVRPEIVYNHFKEMSMKELDLISYKASLEIEKLGGKAVPIPCNIPYEYWDDEKLEGRGVISLKHAAVLAGIGSLGKSTLLINEKFGNMLNLGVLLTDLKLKSDGITNDLCLKGCRLCIENCPASAIKDGGVVQKSCRENSIGKNKKGFDICKCNECRVKCSKNRA